MRKKQIYSLAILFFVIFVAIIIRLAWLSVIEGEKLALKAEEQYTQEINYYQYNRGDFYDTLGRKITGIQAPCLVIFLTMLDNTDTASKSLAKSLSLSAEAISTRISNLKTQGVSSFILKANLNQKEIDSIVNDPLPGVYILPLASRYQNTCPMVHLLGFVSSGFVASEFIGKAGLEKQYDNYLKGHYGPKVAALADEKGRQLTGNGFVLMNQEEEDTSSNIKLTINIDYQQAVEKALSKKEGAVIVLNANNGDILAMASAPKYDPYFWNEPPSDDAYVNKCLALYPPASTFKTVLAAAALAENLPTPTDFKCTGEYLLADGRIVHCWKTTGHGEEDIYHALANSCNCYFIDLGLRLGGDTIKDYAAKMGLDKQEIIGYEVKNGSYIDFQSNVVGDVANASIGEKGVRVSPLMVAQMTAIIANGGKKVFPRLVEEIKDAEGNTVKEYKQKAAVQVIDPNIARAVRNMYRLAVEEGTAWRAGLSGIGCGGKTGTSQEQGIWFTGFAPADKPKWVVTVYLESGVGGGTEAALVFAEVVKAIVNFSGEIN